MSHNMIPAQRSLSYTFTQAGAANQGRFNSYEVRFDPTASRLDVVIGHALLRFRTLRALLEKHGTDSPPAGNGKMGPHGALWGASR
jgi:hypothetical protein